MPSNQKGIAHLLLLLLLVVGIGLGVYLVQNRTNIFPKASISSPTGPETSFSLETKTPNVVAGDLVKVNVMVSSDFDAANTFRAIVSYPANMLEVVSIEPKIDSTQTGMAETGMLFSDSKPAEKENGLLDKLFSAVSAQAAMPVIYGKSYCSGGKPVNELNWTKVQTTDLEYLIFKSPDPYAGSVTVSTYFDRYQYPIKDDGFHTPVRLGTTYTYYLQSFAGVKSNSVSVTTPGDCTATPTPTPTPFPSHSATPTPTPVPSGIPSFITKWIEQTNDINGTLTLVGSVPNPGYKTTQGNKGLMAIITFRAKANGNAKLDFTADSAIYRNSDNQNILSVVRGTEINIGAILSPVPSASASVCPVPTPPVCASGSSIVNTGTSACPVYTCSSPAPSNSVSPSPSPFPPVVDGKRADLYKDVRKPGFINDQDISVFYSKCAEKGVELFGQPASVQPICDIFEDGKITVQDWAVLIKFRNTQT